MTWMMLQECAGVCTVDEPQGSFASEPIRLCLYLATHVLMHCALSHYDATIHPETRLVPKPYLFDERLPAEWLYCHQSGPNNQ